MHRSRPALRLALACAAPWLALACDPAATNASGGAAGTPEGGGQGLVLLTDDPEVRGRTPEELAEDGIRPYFHDFGRVRFGEVVRHAFRFVNTDPAPVTITRIQPSCACTRAELVLPGPDGGAVRVHGTSRGGQATPIPAGVEAEIVMTIDTRHSEPTSHNADKLQTVMIVTDSPNRGYMRLEGHVFIERAFQATPHPLDLGRIPKNGGASGTIDVIAVGGARAHPVGIGPLPPGVRADLVAEPSFGQTLWKVEITLDPPLEPGPVVHRIELMTADADDLPYYPFELEVRAYAADDVDWSPQRFVLRNASVVDGPLETAVELYPLLPGERLRVTGARLDGEGSERLELRYEPNLVDANGRSEKWTLTLATRTPFGEEIVRGKAIVELEGRDPIEIDLLAHPR